MSSFESVEIQPLDKISINQICSAQVVLNLATAVKELVENSIDAGATNIQIKLIEYGSEVVEVTDNGCGVEESNFQALTLKHYTSKITEFPDLYKVKTFGFRGEALSSLCSLSSVTIITQHKNSDIGATLRFNHQGHIINNFKTKRQTGTTVILKNLFSTLPIRRTEFLKNLKREFAKMCNVLYAYGLQSSGVRIMCINHFSKSKICLKETNSETSKKSGSTVVMNVKGDSIESNIISIFGVKQKQNLLKFIQVCPTQETLRNFGLENINIDIKKFQLSGYISSCSHGCGRASSDRQFYYINSRPVDNSKISKLINEIYHQYNNQQDPFVLLDIKVTCGSFDMNLTPDKRQILLQDEKLLLAIIKESLHSIFKSITCTLEIQNLKLLKNITAEKEIVSAEQKLKKFQANIRNPSKKQEHINTEPTIKNSLKFQLPTKLTTSQIITNKEPLESIFKIEDLEGKYKKKSTLSLQDILKEKSQLESSYKLNSSSTQSTKTVELLTVESFEEQNPQMKIFENESKRKLNQNLGVNSFKFFKVEEENKEAEIKRIKLDSGLDKNDKSNRKKILFHITFSDVQRLHKDKQRKREANFDNSKVKFLATITPQSSERAECELKKEIKKESFKNMEIVGQFNLGFIITKLESDLFIIDQHASDEKYNFETLQANVVMEVQKLFTPEKMELTIEKEELILQHRDIFRKNGFEFIFDEKEPPTKRVSLVAKPHSKNTIFGKNDVDELLFQLEKVPEFKNLRLSRVDNLYASRACRKSVMIGTALNKQEMKKIVTHMGEIEQPWNCPHGRPTMRHLINLKMLNLEI